MQTVIHAELIDFPWLHSLPASGWCLSILYLNRTDNKLEFLPGAISLFSWNHLIFASVHLKHRGAAGVSKMATLPTMDPQTSLCTLCRAIWLVKGDGKWFTHVNVSATEGQVAITGNYLLQKKLGFFFFFKLRRPIISPTAVVWVVLLTQFLGGNSPYAPEHLVNYSKCQVSSAFVHANVLFMPSEWALMMMRAKTLPKGGCCLQGRFCMKTHSKPRRHHSFKENTLSHGEDPEKTKTKSLAISVWD